MEHTVESGPDGILLHKELSTICFHRDGKSHVRETVRGYCQNHGLLYDGDCATCRRCQEYNRNLLSTRCAEAL